MPRKTLIAVASVFIALLGLVSVAVASSPVRLSSALEWRYGEHTATVGGTQVLDASHFVQRYSFLARKSDTIADGRLGEYRLALGYEWSWIDSRQGDGTKIIIDNPLDKILYRGEVKIEPGGLPFKFHAFSYDMGDTSFASNDFGELFGGRGYDGPSETVIGLSSSKNIRTGIILESGVANGSYDGNYRNLLHSLPRFLLDFSQVDVSDENSLAKLDFVDRNLAFVSLNKKNNWLHYRLFTHKDRVDSTNNLVEQTYRLGTLDHLNQRHWVDLVNWIKVSADISYMETTKGTPQLGQSSLGRYDVNLFARARRALWETSSYSSYRRESDGYALERSLDVPLYASGTLSRDTNWRINMVGKKTQGEKFTGGLNWKTDSVYGQAQVTTFRQSRYVFTSTVAAEGKQDLTSEAYATSVGAEFSSNSMYRSPYRLFGRYVARIFSADTLDESGLDFSEHQAEVSVQTDFNSQLSGGFSQMLLQGEGRSDVSYVDNIGSAAISLIGTAVDVSRSDSSAFQSLSKLFISHRSLSGLSNRLELALDYRSTSGGKGVMVDLSHSLDYSSRGPYRIVMTNQLSRGDKQDAAVGEADGFESGYVREEDQSFSHKSILSYSPGRAMKAKLRLSYDKYTFVDVPSIESFEVSWDGSYTWWSYGGLIRRHVVLGYEFDLARGQKGDFDNFTLFAKYYPTRLTLLATRLNYDVDKEVEGNDTFTATMSAGVDFRKLKLSLDYSYAARTAESSVSERTEHRWEAKIKKLF